MLREIAHFTWHAPKTLWMKARLSQNELYDYVIGNADRAGLAEQRRELASDLRGEVLEIGVGTGAMLPHYDRDAHVTGIEPDEKFLDRAKAIARKNTTLAVGDVEKLSFPDAKFDAVVACLVLCSVNDPAKALSEIRRVLKPGGEVRLIEHVVSDKPVERALMRAFDPVWIYLNGQGCRMSRDTESLISQSFDIVERHPFQVFAAGIPAFPMRRLRCVL